MFQSNNYLYASDLKSHQSEKPTEKLPFFKFLEALERSKQWDEREVLKRLCIPRTTYRSWRDGTSEPSKRAYWIKLSNTFGVPIEALIRVDLTITWRLK